MLRAMDSAVSGLRAHQNKLDVIGNNLANVSTFGYKSQSIGFKEALYQNMTNSVGGKMADGADAALTGGQNAAQFGYGVMTGSITTDMGTSTPTFVGGFNACINGPGFFVTRRENLVDENGKAIGVDSTTEGIKGNNFDLGRVGQFSIDANGYVVEIGRAHV